MRPTEEVPFRAVHKFWGEGTVVRTNSDGAGRARRPVFRADDDGIAERTAWGDIEPLSGSPVQPENASRPPSEEASGIEVSHAVAVLTLPAQESDPKLHDSKIEELIQDAGLDPADWTIGPTKLNKWNAMTSDKATGDNRIVWMYQYKVTLLRSPEKLLASPAMHRTVPPVRRVPGPPKSEKPELIVVEGDHQVPYQDTRLDELSLEALRDLSENHRLTEHVLHGDTIDFATISKYADHPAAMESVNEGIQGGYELIRRKREAASNARCRKMKGNHDWRVEAELLLRAERLYGIKPADTPEKGPELPALSLRRLLHLDALGVELVEDRRGWEHAEIELVPGPRGLVVRHGWIVGQNTAAKSLKARGRSLIVGHKHTREHVYDWDAGSGVERQAVVSGVMCRVRDGRFPHFAVCDNWSQGFVVVTRWPDGRFEIDHARYDGEVLSWRDRRWG